MKEREEIDQSDGNRILEALEMVHLCVLKTVGIA